MRKLLLSALAFSVIGMSFGQIAQQNQIQVQTGANNLKKIVVPNLNAQSQELNLSLNLTDGEFTGHGMPGHSCASHDLTKEHYEERGVWQQVEAEYQQTAGTIQPPAVAKTPGVNTISVIFHVVHNPNNPAENVSNAAIMNVYNDIVEDYQLLNANASNARPGFTPADVNINFCLATQDPLGNPLAETGVIRVSTTEDFYDSDNGEENKMKSSTTGGSDIWDRDDYLNIYICDITNGANSGTAGYAYRPTPSFLPGAAIDGIVLDYNLGVNNENVLTHEIGHYLGLDHTWGGSGGCGNDDGFGDTPITAGPSFNYAGSCSGSQQTCSGTETQYENYMDYSNCTVMFTQDQANYMLSILTGIRSSLLLSPGCDPTNTPPTTDFTADVTTIPVGGAVNFTDLSTNVPTGWAWTFGGGAAASSLQNPAITFNTVGTYDVALVATNAFGSNTETKVAYIQVVAPAAGSACDTLRNYDVNSTNYTFYNLNNGYLPGTGALDAPATQTVAQVAEHFVALATAEVRRVTVPIFVLEDVSGTASVTMHVYGHDATNNIPTVSLASETFLFSDLTEGAFNELDFTTPASVTGDFWVGFEMTYAATWDTIVFGVNDTEITTPAEQGFAIDVTGFGWQPNSFLTGSGVVESINMDVMLSNGTAPVADLQFSEGEVCVGGEIDVNGSGSMNTTNYFWFLTDEPITTILEDTTSAATTFTLPTAGDYRITLFADGACQSDGLAVIVTANPQITATVTPTATTCGLNNGSVDITNPLNGDGLNYEYSLDGVNYVTTSTWNNLPSGNYDVYIRTTGDNCEVMYSTTIGASAPFTATVTGNQAVCAGGSATMTAVGGNTYNWSDGSNPLGTMPSITETPATTTQYECLVTDGVGCQSLVYTTVTVNPILDASFTFNDFCDGAASNGPTGIVTAGGVFAFNPLPGDGATISASTGEIFNGVLSTTYTVEYTTSGTCPDSNTETVTVNTSDDASFSSADWCSNGTHSVSGIVTPGGTFALNPLPGDGAVISASTGEITNAVAGNSYTIEYTTPASACQTSSTQTVTFNTAPTVGAGTDFAICLGQTATLSGTGADTYDWGGVVLNNTAFTPNGTATYTVTGTALNGCTATDDIIVTVNTLPTVNAGADQAECDGASVTLAASGTATSYVWDNGVTDNTAFTPVVGTLTYTVTGTDANNCSATDMVDVTINANPTVDAGVLQTVCEGTMVTLTGVGAVTYAWDNGVVNNVAFTPAVGTLTYTVTGTDANNCSATDMVDVTVNALPTVTIGTFANMCDNHAAITLSGATPAGGTYSGTGVSAGMFDPAVSGIGTHDITYSFTDANNCSNSATETLTVDNCADIHEDEIDALNVYPNPSTDELNIEFSGQFEVQLFDVNGKLVYAGNGNNKLIVNVSSYESGIYLIRLHAEGKFYQKRIVRK